jgi:plastocyanin
MTAAPEGTPVGREVAVESHVIDFEPDECAILAASDVRVRVPNRGAATHHFSDADRNNPGVPNLGIAIDLAPGPEDSVTKVALAGDHCYVCNAPGHEAVGMSETIRVE